MPKPTKSDRKVHAQFLARQKAYEAKYVRIFFSILSKQYKAAAKIYPEHYVVSPNDYRAAIVNVYSTCVPNEAKIAWDYYVVPLTSDQKDFFDDLASLLGFDIPSGEHIRLWRSLTAQWLDVNILTKIQGIAQTTQRAIAKVIQQGLDEGLGEREIAKYIQEQAGGEINQYRSRLIARTETVMAMGTGRRWSMLSSGLRWLHKWVDTADERTRTSHRIIANEDWIPIEEDYILEVIKDGGIIGQETARFPGDPKLSPGNICNCRCCETFQVDRDAAGRPKKRTGTPIKIVPHSNLQSI